MKRERSLGLRATEHLGEHALEFSASRWKPGVAVTPRPAGDSSTLAIDVLRALDKRAWSSAGTIQKEAPERTALLWILASGIETVFVVNADWMDESQFEFAAELATRASVWLLFAGAIADCAQGSAAPWIVSRAELESKLGTPRPEENVAPALDRSRLADLPTASALRFRAACEHVLDEAELAQVDRAMVQGAIQNKTIIARGGGEADARRFLLEANPSSWDALARLRGAELAAIAHGWRFKFDLEQWVVGQEAGDSLRQSERTLLLSLYDPRAAMLYLTARLTTSTGHEIANLPCGALDEDGQRIATDRGSVRLPDDLTEIARAYVERFTKEEPATTPLFRTKTGKKLTPKGASRAVLDAAKQLALPAPRACFPSFGWETRASLDVDFRPLQLQASAS